MNKIMKQQLINDILTGLVVAAAFAAVVPHDVLAQTLQNAVDTSKSSVGTPFVQTVSYISYGMGTVFAVAGIAGAKKHADNPQSNPLNPALGKLGAGAAFLAAPSVVNMLQGTGSQTFGSGTGNASTPIGF